MEAQKQAPEFLIWHDYAICNVSQVLLLLVYTLSALCTHSYVPRINVQPFNFATCPRTNWWDLKASSTITSESKTMQVLVSALLPHWYPDTVKSNRCLHCNQKAPSPVFMPIVSFASVLFLIYSTYAKPFLIRNKVDGGCSIPSRRLRHDLIHVSSWNGWMDGWMDGLVGISSQIKEREATILVNLEDSLWLHSKYSGSRIRAYCPRKGSLKGELKISRVACQAFVAAKWPWTIPTCLEMKEEMGEIFKQNLICTHFTSHHLSLTKREERPFLSFCFWTCESGKKVSPYFWAI
jgi:hypothetical protein